MGILAKSQVDYFVRMAWYMTCKDSFQVNKDGISMSCWDEFLWIHV